MILSSSSHLGILHRPPPDLTPPFTVALNGSDSMPLATTNRSLSPSSRSAGTAALVVITLAPVATPIEVTVAPASVDGGVVERAAISHVPAGVIPDPHQRIIRCRHRVVAVADGLR